MSALPPRPPGEEARLTIGWREWLGLPELGVERIKVKVDTGARSSALHAFDIERFMKGEEPWVRFLLHPVQRDNLTSYVVETRMIDERRVRPSTGKVSLRPVIATVATLGRLSWPIEVTLVNRDMMGFRMLLGRQAIRRRFLVDPARSFLLSRRDPARRRRRA